MREAVQALVDRGLTARQAGRELGLSSPHLAHYYASRGTFRGQHMTNAREWLEGLPPREAVERACDLIEALCDPPSGPDPLQPWPGLRLYNARYSRLLAFLWRQSRKPEAYRAVHWERLRAVIFQDLFEWQAAGRKEVWYRCDRLDRLLRFRRAPIDARRAELVPLAHPFGRVAWREGTATLELAPGVPPPWAGHEVRPAR